MGSAPPFDLSTLPPSVRAALEISQGVARKRESRPPGTPAPKAPSNHEADAEGETSGRSVRPEPSSSIPPPRVEPSSEGGFEGGGVPRVRRSTLQTYEEIVDRLERDHPGMLGAIFREAEPVVVHEEKIILAFSEGSFFGDQAGERAHRETLLDVAEQVLGQRPELEIRRVPEIDPSKTLAGLSETRKRSDEERRRREALEHPRVLDALDVFPKRAGASGSNSKTVRGELMSIRGGMNEFMRQAARMQRRIEKRREELKEETFEESAGNDRVKVKVSGALEITAIEVDPGLLEEEGLEMVQDLIVAASNAALARARETIDKEIEKVSAGLKIPGLV